MAWLKFLNKFTYIKKIKDGDLLFLFATLGKVHLAYSQNALKGRRYFTTIVKLVPVKHNIILSIMFHNIILLITQTKSLFMLLNKKKVVKLI